MIDVGRKKFRFELLDGKTITGDYNDTIDKQMRMTKFDDEIRATFSHIIKYNDATDTEIEEWELVKIDT